MNTAPTIDRTAPTIDHSATYSPEDNKLRIYPAHRLSAEEYARVKAAGFIWAPKQETFVAPMWTPAREDLAREMCGEIGDEDTSLCDRAEQRADRFSDYGDKRAQDAASARAAVSRIADGIPFGQPILVGHHSERHARKDAERIESGMRRAVDMWETSSYWKARAAGAIRAAKYKERPDVRARRIKGLESDQRKQQKNRDEAAALLRAWSLAHSDTDSSVKRKDGTPTTFAERALFIANRDHVSQCFPLADFPRDLPASQYEGQMSLWSALDGGVISPAQAAEIAQRVHTARIAHADRWLQHLANRLEYERAMLAESGGLAADKFDLQPGGVIIARHGRQVIERVNRREGAVLSVSVIGQGWTVGVEEITAYEPPTEQAAAAVAAVTAKAPLCNYPSEGCATMTAAQWAKIYTDSKGTRTVKATDTAAAHRRRCVLGFIGTNYGAPRGDQWGHTWVFISDAKETRPVDPSAPVKPKRKSTARKIAEAAGIDTSAATVEADPAPAVEPSPREVLADLVTPGPLETAVEIERMQARRAAREATEAEGAEFAAMREALRTGQAVQVVSAPQLFPTPAHVAARMVELADVQPGDRVLEPSAGTGALLQALRTAYADSTSAAPVVHAWEINRPLAQRLRDSFPAAVVRAFDFLEFDPNPSELFDVVLMNPPFKDAADVRHILHARRFIAPGGRLVAICAAGPRQHEALQPLADSWEYLPPGTFEGTGVRTVLLTMGPA